MERSFEQIFIDSLVDALAKTAASREELQDAPGMTPEQGKAHAERMAKEDFARKPFLERMKAHGKGAYESIKGQTKGVASKIHEGWKGSSTLGKGLMIGAPAAAIGGTALTAAALTHALRGKKKED